MRGLGYIRKRSTNTTSHLSPRWRLPGPKQRPLTSLGHDAPCVRSSSTDGSSIVRGSLTAAGCLSAPCLDPGLSTCASSSMRWRVRGQDPGDDEATASGDDQFIQWQSVDTTINA